KTRALCQVPIENDGTKSSKLYYKMAKVVGPDNILPPPSSFTNDKDRVEWLTYDSNRLLYFWYKNKKIRQKIQYQTTERNSCGWMFYDNNGNCTDNGKLCVFVSLTSLFLTGIIFLSVQCCCMNAV